MTVQQQKIQDDPLGLKSLRTRVLVWATVLLIALAVAAFLGITVGAVPLTLGETLNVIAHHTLTPHSPITWSPSVDAIIWQVRLPRVLLAVVVGASLAVSGMVLQAMVRNVLAEPYLLGINSGASAGAALAILFGAGVGAFGAHALQATAFLGALASSIAVYLLARTGGRITSLRLLLAGVAVGYALNAVTSFLIFASGDAEGTRSVMFWLLGSLSLAAWGTPLTATVIITALTGIIFWTMSKHLDVLSVGDESAVSLGISPEKIRLILLVIISLNVGAVVATAGSIGFVGLIIPHLARRCAGALHRASLPIAALMGATLLTLADLVARTVLAPQEIPIGILTALVGTPFLLVLIKKMRSYS